MMTSEAAYQAGHDDQAPGLNLPATPTEFDIDLFMAAVLQDKGGKQQWMTAPRVAQEYGLTAHQAKRIAAFFRTYCQYCRGGRQAHVRIADRRKIKVRQSPVTEYLICPRYEYAKKK